jgi:GxxExxY protein
LGLDQDIERIATVAIDIGLGVHRELGPGLMESVYETVLANRLIKQGLHVETQKAVAINVDGLNMPNAFRADILLENKLLIELKSTDRLANIHMMQLLTYLRLMNLPLGFLFNFGEETFKQGIKRVMNNHAR